MVTVNRFVVFSVANNWHLSESGINSKKTYVTSSPGKFLFTLQDPAHASSTMKTSLISSRTMWHPSPPQLNVSAKQRSPFRCHSSLTQVIPLPSPLLPDRISLMPSFANSMPYASRGCYSRSRIYLANLRSQPIVGTALVTKRAYVKTVYNEFKWILLWGFFWRA